MENGWRGIFTRPFSSTQAVPSSTLCWPLPSPGHLTARLLHERGRTASFLSHISTDRNRRTLYMACTYTVYLSAV